MAISSPGVGSGLDVNSIVTQLMNIERQPIVAMQNKEASYKAQLSAYGTISSALTDFQSAAKALASSTGFQSYTTSSSNSTVLDASASGSATLGAHTITVTKLAATEIQAAATGYASSTTALGLTGTLDFSFGSVTVAATDTLTDIQGKINSASGNTVASATIVNDGSASPYKLVIAARNSGTTGSVAITDNLSTPFGFAVTQPADDAVLTVDGISVTSHSNTISSVISGVSLNLKSLGSSTVGVSLDTSAVTAKIQTFVDTYNKLVQTMKTMRQKGGKLESDGTLLSLQSNLRNVFNSAAAITGNDFKYLTQVGVSFQKDGTLLLNTSKLQTALSSNYDNVVSLFSDSTQGFAKRLDTITTSMLDPLNGLLASTTSSINSKISWLDKRMDQLNANLLGIEARYRRQFAQLDSFLGSMTNTSNYLTQQFKNLSGSSNG